MDGSVEGDLAVAGDFINMATQPWKPLAQLNLTRSLVGKATLCDSEIQ
jgi:hypothetical protein